jgi:DNA-binding NtrC family response regulator
MSPHVLVMEDDVLLCRLFCKGLAAAGYHTQAAFTILQAIDYIQSNHIDVFICDMQIGSNQSTAFLQNFQHRLHYTHTRIVIVSGYIEYKSVVKELGIEYFFEKPVTVNTLVSLLREIAPINS